MRIGFDARWYNKSGVGSYGAGLLPALVRAGCDLVVYVDDTNPVPGLDQSFVKIVPVRSGKYSPFATLEFRSREKKDNLDCRRRIWPRFSVMHMAWKVPSCRAAGDWPAFSISPRTAASASSIHASWQIARC
jgi:hypothetical protein